MDHRIQPLSGRSGREYSDLGGGGGGLFGRYCTTLGLALTTFSLLFALGCRDPHGGLTGGRLVFEETFDGQAISEMWRVGFVDGPASRGGGPRNPADAKGHWRIEDGSLTSPGERNQALWLTKPLPENVRVEFEAWSDSEAGDIKIEIFGDGARHESGYILVFGGWNNTLSVMARLDEHETGRVERGDFVEKGRRYKMAVVRTGRVLRWYMDGKLYLHYRDREPLRGEGHQHFAFNNWTSRLWFDNLRIYDLDEQ